MLTEFALSFAAGILISYFIAKFRQKKNTSFPENEITEAPHLVKESRKEQYPYTDTKMVFLLFST